MYGDIMYWLVTICLENGKYWNVKRKVDRLPFKITHRSKLMSQGEGQRTVLGETLLIRKKEINHEQLKKLLEDRKFNLTDIMEANYVSLRKGVK